MKTIIYFIFFVITAFSQEQASCTNELEVVLIDYHTNTFIANAQISLYDAGNQMISKTTSDENGVFSFKNLSCSSQYSLVVIKENYAKRIKFISTRAEVNKYNFKMKLVPIPEFSEEEGVKTIQVKQINFFPNSLDLTKEALKELDKVSKILLKYDYLKLEINFHTDTKGGRKYMLKLTQQRADVCRDYLISKAISPDRITARGYGGEAPLNHCTYGVKCSDKEHRLNRRSVFIVL